MFDAQMFTQLLLKLLVERAAIRQYLAVPDFPQVGNELVQTGQVRAGDVYRRRLWTFDERILS